MNAGVKISPVIFGPVPSRRLGRSLGVNAIPPKTCSYACVYCQAGKTHPMQIRRDSFCSPDEIVSAARNRIDDLMRNGYSVDYLSLVPDGEPTLDMDLKREISGLKRLGFPVAVITNGSLLWDEAVRRDLKEADWVSVKVDTVEEDAWHRINRPHGRLSLCRILEGIRLFSEEFRGTRVTETMLVSGINDDETAAEATALFLAEIDPQTAFISVPTRPPVESWVRPPDEQRINRIFQIFQSHVQTELLIQYEGNAFDGTGKAEEDLLGILSVHPMREDAVREFLEKAGREFSVAEKLIQSGRVTLSVFRGNRFYVRSFSKEFSP